MADPRASTEFHLRTVQGTAELCLDSILALFKPGMKATILIRNPEVPSGGQDFVYTNDPDLLAAAEALRIRDDAAASGDPGLVRVEGESDA